MSRKLDGLVAVHVTKIITGPIVKWWGAKGENADGGSVIIPAYSEENSAAWDVVEEWGVLPWNIDNGWREKDGERISGVTCKVTTHTGSFEATEKDMPMAVCVCALRAVGVDEATIQEAMK